MQCRWVMGGPALISCGACAGTHVFRNHDRPTHRDSRKDGNELYAARWVPLPLPAHKIGPETTRDPGHAPALDDQVRAGPPVVIQNLKVWGCRICSQLHWLHGEYGGSIQGLDQKIRS